jgi:signal transduction histidine kinase
VTLAWVAAFATVCLLYLLRARHLTRTVHARLAAQMSERERIARDLHDTLLQEVTGLLLRFHAVSMRVAPQEPVRQMLNEALDRGDEMLVQARDTVRGLRTEAGASEDLSLAFTEYAKRLLVGDGAAAFRVTTAGSPWRLRSIIRDEIVHIGQEAINNAFTHSRATRIDVELNFSKGSLVVVVRDNGCGIPPAILQDGRREGHWGLIGMRERAGRAGGRLRISSSPDAGTLIELKVPAAIAAAAETTSSSPRSWLQASLRRLWSDRARQGPDRL